jgi:hypothetical protein
LVRLAQTTAPFGLVCCPGKRNMLSLEIDVSFVPQVRRWGVAKTSPPNLLKHLERRSVAIADVR